MTGFKPYQRKGGDVKAQAIDTNMEIPVTLEDGSITTMALEPGDYLILTGTQLDGAKKADFEQAFEPARKVSDKPKVELTAEQKEADRKSVV